MYEYASIIVYVWNYTHKGRKNYMYSNKKEKVEKIRSKNIADCVLHELKLEQETMNLEMRNNEKDIKVDYREMYFILFHTITCALEILQELEEETAKKACDILKNGQSRGEEMYVSNER